MLKQIAKLFPRVYQWFRTHTHLFSLLDLLSQSRAHLHPLVWRAGLDKFASRKPKPISLPQLEILEDRTMPSITSTWIGGSTGNWNDSANWDNGIPSGSLDTAILDTSGATVNLDTNVTIANLELSAGTLSGYNTLHLGGSGSVWSGGTISGMSLLDVLSGGTLTINGTAAKTYSGSLLNDGTIDWTQGDIALNSAFITNASDGVFTMADGVNFTRGLFAYNTFGNSGTLNVGGVGAAGTNEWGIDSFYQNFTGILAVEVQQTSGSVFDQLQISGFASLGGTLQVRALSGYSVSVGDDFPFLTANFTFAAFSSYDVDSFGTGTAASVAYNFNHTDLDIVTPPTVQLSASSFQAYEDATQATITATLSSPLAQTVTVPFTTSDDTAIAGTDYTAVTAGSITIPAGSTSGVGYITLLNDVESSDVAFDVALGTPVNATLGSTTSASVTIVQPPTVQLSASTSNVSETASYAMITATLSHAWDSNISVSYATADGSATAGTDYTSTSSSLTIYATSTSNSFYVPILNHLESSDVTFDAELSSPSGGATLGTPDTQTVTIQQPLSVQLSSSTVTAYEDAADVILTVTLSHTWGATVTVDYATSNGSATAGTDFTSTSGTLTFSPFVTSQTITVPILDYLQSSAVNFYVALSSPTTATLGSPYNATVTIVQPPTIQFSAASYLTYEDLSSVTITGTLSHAWDSTVTAAYATTDGSATAGTDYTSTSGTLTISAGSTSNTFDVPILNYAHSGGGSVDFTVALSSPTNATLGGSDTTDTVAIEQPPTVQLSASTYNVNESDSQATITATLSNAWDADVTVHYATSDGTATAGTDYTSTSGTLTITAGSTSNSFNVPLLNHSEPFSTATFDVTLSSPSNATLGTPDSATVDIAEPVPTVQFSSGSYSVNEGDGTATITVTLSHAWDQTVTVDYATSDGTATAGSAYTSASGTLTFSAGQTSKNFTVTILDEDLTSGDKTVNLALSNPVHATMGGSAGIFTEYTAPTGAYPSDLVTGPDGNLWFSTAMVATVGKITTAGSITDYSLPSSGGGAGSLGITLGPDGNLWFTEDSPNKIGKITTGGSITEYSVPTAYSYPHRIVTGSDGNLWFTESSANQIARSTTSGSITEYSIPTGSSYPTDLVAGPDGNLWFTEQYGNKIGRITTSGTVTEFTIPTGYSSPEGIISGPDGNLWFVESANGKVAKITTSGTITEYTVSGWPTTLATGPDGNIWYVNSSQIYKMTTAGVDTLVGTNSTSIYGYQMVLGPDNNFWVAEFINGKIAKITSGTSNAVLTIHDNDIINNAPVGTSNTFSTTESTGAHVFASSDFGFTDPSDSPANNFASVEITTLPTGGTLTDNGTAVTAGQFIPVTDLNDGYLVYTAVPVTVTLTNPGQQTNNDADVVSLSLTATDSASNTLVYTASGLPDGLSIDSSTGAISGTLDDTASKNSPYLVTVFASDATANVAAIQQFAWIVNPVKVTLVNPGLQTNLDSDAVSLVLQATDSAGHSLSYSASGLPTGLSLSGHTISGTIGSGADTSSPYPITISATDSTASVTNTQVFAWVVSASTPSSGTVSLDNPGNLLNYDGDTVSLTLNASDSASNPLSFSATGLPSGLSINSSTGVISGTVGSSADTSSPYLITVTATDTVTSDSVTQADVWVVKPVPATTVFVTLTNPGMPINVDGNSVSMTLSATDSAAHTLTYSASGLPTGLSISGNTISGTIGSSADASSPFVVTITATDSTASVSATQTYVWVVKSANYDSFTFQVKDDGGTAHGGHDTDATARTMHIALDQPIAVTDVGSTPQNTALTIAASTLLANDTDPDSHLLSITDYTQPQNGSLTYDGTNFVYTPTDGFTGADQFDYTINDGFGGTSTATVFLVVQPLPIAVDDWAYVAPNTPTTLDVLQNDYDGGIKAFTIESTTTPTHGIVSIARDGSILTYTPTTSYVGADSFTYTVLDRNGNTATATVHITIGNGQWATSVISASSTYTDSGPYDWYAVQALGEPNTFDYGDVGTAWSPENEGDGTQTISLGFATSVYANGVLVRETNGNGFVTQIDLLDTSNVWHNAVWTGTDSSAQTSPVDFIATFTQTTYLVKGVRISVDTDKDANDYAEIDAVRLLSASAVTPSTNHAPTITSDPTSASVDEDTSTTDVDSSVNIDISGLASDADSDPLVLSILSDPSNGTVTINDNGTPNDFSDDYLTYSPNPLFNGSDSFIYQVTDIHGATATGTVNVTVNAVNHAPDAEPAFATTDKNTAVTIDVVTNDSDPDGDTLSVSIPSGDGPSHGTASISSNNIVYTPTTGYTGIDQLTYQISNGRGGTATAQATIIVYQSGEWASSVINVSSQYDPCDGSTDYAATQALGAPDTFGYGDNFTAFAPANDNDGTGASDETLTVGFATPTAATGVVVRETDGNGFITQIELQDTGNTWHTIWSGTDPAQAGKPTDTILTFVATTYNVKAVRLSIDTNHDLDNWEEIDAVRLLTGGTPTGTSITAVGLNTPPEAADDYTTTEQNQPVTVSVLANDSDPDGDALTVLSKTDGTHGTVAINSGSLTVTYTPDTGYSGTDTFTYVTSDGNGGTSSATVHLTVYATGEWATSVVSSSSQRASGPYDGYALQALGAPDTFAEGDAPTAWGPQYEDNGLQTIAVGFTNHDYATGVLVRETDGNGFVTKIELQDTSNAWHTVWTGTDSSTSTDVADFVISFSTTSYQVQAARITVDTTLDSTDFAEIDAIRLFTATATSPTDSAPTASGISAETTENVPINIAAMSSVSGGTGIVYLSIVSQPTNGTVSINDAGTPGDTSDDFLQFTPNANFSGTDSFVYAAVDSWGGIATATVSLTVDAVNQPPQTQADIAYTTPSTTVTINVLANDSDPENDTLTIQSATDGQHGTVAILTGSLTVAYTPDTYFVGSDYFTYTISDGHGNTAIGQVNVTVYPDGAWASSFSAVSSGSASASSALGEPDDTSWTPDGVTQLEFLTVGFTTPAYSKGLLIREGGGSIMQVQLIDTSGTYHTIWTGTDPSSGNSDFVLTFPATSYQVSGAKVLLNGQSSPSIDAVRLLTGGSPTSSLFSICGYDNSGDYLVTYYNSASQPITIYTYAQGQQIQIVSNTYDGSGNLSTKLTFDAADNETYDTFDTSGNKTAETVAFGSADAATTDYQYNASGKVTQVTDPDGNVTLFTFDDKGNELSMTDPSGNVEAMTYNDKGLLDTETNRNGLKIAYTYDDSGRETEEDWYASDGTTITETDTWTYTPDGKIATASNSQGTYAFKYNDAGQLIHVDEPFGVSLDFAYDDNGNRILVKDSLGGTEESNYNASNQLISRILVQGSETMRIDMTYDQYGRVVTETRYSDAAGTSLVGKTTYTYDAFGNVSSILNTDASNANIDEFDYEYNLAGQLLSESDLQPAISSTAVTDTYTYDDQEELTGDGTNSYDYDLNGNRNTGNTYDTTNTNLLLSDGTWDYGYDDEGNMTGKVNISTGEQWTYGYNNKNELIQAKQFDASSTLEMEADYKYDVFGNRDEKDVTTGGVTTVQRYVLDGWNPAKPTPTGNENFDVIADLDGSNTEVTRYFRGDNVDELDGRMDQSGASNPAGTYWTLSDHLGSVRDVINNSGVVKDAIQYDSYGNINSTTETDASYRGRYAWTGREIDVETRLQYNRARYYDAGTGRWISQDPLGFDAGDSNLYRYVTNQPTMKSDPSGLQQAINLNILKLSANDLNDLFTDQLTRQDTIPTSQLAIMLTAYNSLTMNGLLIPQGKVFLTTRFKTEITAQAKGLLIASPPTTKYPVKGTDGAFIQQQTVQKWLSEVNSSTFSVRQSALANLIKVAPLVLGDLARAYKYPLNLEYSRRIGSVIDTSLRPYEIDALNDVINDPAIKMYKKRLLDGLQDPDLDDFYPAWIRDYRKNLK